MKFMIEFIENYCLVTTTGIAKAETFNELLDAVLLHERWLPGKPLITDNSDLITDALTNDDIRQMAVSTGKKHSLTTLPMRFAIVAPQDLQYGLSRMLTTYLADKSKAATNVFRTREEAIYWVSS